MAFPVGFRKEFDISACRQLTTNQTSAEVFGLKNFSGCFGLGMALLYSLDRPSHLLGRLFPRLRSE